MPEELCTLRREELRPRKPDVLQHVRQIENTIRSRAAEGATSYTFRCKAPPPFYYPWIKEMADRGFKITVLNGDWDVRVCIPEFMDCDLCGRPAEYRAWCNRVKLCKSCAKFHSPTDISTIAGQKVPMGTGFAPKR